VPTPVKRLAKGAKRAIAVTASNQKFTIVGQIGQRSGPNQMAAEYVD